ncbi:DivIVA domain-containing protein [Micromonospora deserti]|uniref:DivIVA domain-containing protein n=1 Tax=Micromonospora deserti TaxID=2070366 RepID=UPI001F43AE17|nr:DivIVA domain-containing protein [Micromonospora deserti]
MGQVLLLLVVALTVAAVVFGVTVLVTGRDPGLAPAEPDGRAVPLPGARPLRESDVGEVRFDTALRGYRMAQVDQAMRRAAYDIGYKSELIGVLEAEVAALREGRTVDADVLRRARERAAGTQAEPAGTAGDAEPSVIELGQVGRPAAGPAQTAGSTADDTGAEPVAGEDDADTRPTVDEDAGAPPRTAGNGSTADSTTPTGDAGRHGPVVRSESA